VSLIEINKNSAAARFSGSAHLQVPSASTGEGWTSPISPATERRIRESGGGLGGTCRGVLPDGFRHRQTAKSKPPSFTPKEPKGPVIHLGLTITTGVAIV
jgi:hypothetical protein